MDYRKLIFCTSIFFVLASFTPQFDKDSTKIVSKILTNRKVVALTFDDGPNPKTTPRVLAILEAKQVKATFFVLGENIDKFPKVFAQEVIAGHEIGNHGYSHALLPKISKTQIEDEIETTANRIRTLAPTPTLFRPPEGKYDKNIIDIANNYHYTIILWSIDPQDWSSPPVNKVVDTVLNNIKPGSIILLHDGLYPLPTPEALGTIIDRLKEQDYELVTVSELLKYYNDKPILTLN